MKVFSTALKPVFLVLIRCLALSTPGSMSCVGGAGEMGKKKSCKFWPWGSKEAAGAHLRDELVVIWAMGSSAAGWTRLLREDPELPNFSIRVLESRKLSPAGRQSRAGSQSWIASCKIWGAAGTGATCLEARWLLQGWLRGQWLPSPRRFMPSSSLLQRRRAAEE